MNTYMRLIFIYIGCCFITIIKAQDADIVRPSGNGFIIFAGMELPSGKIVSKYIIERSSDKKNWQQIAELKVPATYDEFSKRLVEFQAILPHQSLPDKKDWKMMWEKANKYGTIDSIRPWSGSTIIRLATSLAYYDKQIEKNKEYAYRVSIYSTNGGSDKKNVSSSFKWPYYTAFDKTTLIDQYVNKKFLYLKWSSMGTNPATSFKVMYYQDAKLNIAKGLTTVYNIGETTYFVFQDSIKTAFAERQYFLMPIDFYGCEGNASEISFISSFTSKEVYFSKSRANGQNTIPGIKLTWKLNEIKPVKSINIYRSNIFDSGYELFATVPVTDTTFTDQTIVPDKFYYYYLEAVNKYNGNTSVSAKLFDYGQDKMKPLTPYVLSYRSVSKGTELTIKASDVNLAGVRVYKFDKVIKDYKPVSDLLRLKNEMVTWSDTSSMLTGNSSFVYAVKSENTSFKLSDYSKPVYIMSGRENPPPAINRLTSYEESRKVHLLWENLAEDDISIRGYIIYRRELPNGKLTLINASDSICPNNYYTDSLVKSNNSYEYAVRTLDYFGGVSKTISLTTIQLSDDTPEAPSAFSGYPSENKIVLSWSVIRSSEKYNVKLYKYQVKTKPALLKTFSNNENEYTDSDIKKGELNIYYITYENKNKKESLPSRKVSLMVK